MNTKICSKCGIEKEFNEFDKDKNAKLGLSSHCKLCCSLNKYNRLRKKNKKLGKRTQIPTLLARQNRLNGVKYCPKCHETKSVEEFSNSKNSNSGKASHCKECCKVLSKSHSKDKRRIKYERNKEKLLDNNLKRDFDISLQAYKIMLANQQGKCYICGKTEKENGKRLAVDHNHKTGKVRDLLCGKCNAAIGFLDECTQKTLNLLEYLKKWKNK